jgi:isopenicillin-N epimerase
MDEQPMDFFVRALPSALMTARRCLAEFVGTSESNLVFVENATQAMNVVARNFVLSSGDEVLLTDHEYGAVKRIWERRARETGALCRHVRLPCPIESNEQLVDAIFSGVSDRTKLLVVSHITSPTAVTFPVAEICEKAAARGIPVCIDGPHAIAQLDVHLDRLNCAYYAASCHKWLSAPFGSGFLYVHPRCQSSIQPMQQSWGLLRPAEPKTWDDEFVWTGTRDPSAYLAIPSAIRFLQEVGLEDFRGRTHYLAQYARRELAQFSSDSPIAPDSSNWYGSMAHMPLPPGDSNEFQKKLWSQFGIEVPIVSWNERRWIRVSCYLYNRQSEIDTLVSALRTLL